MRLFVSLDLPDAFRQSLAAWRPPLDGVRWTPPERLHLTLRFLGEVEEDRCAAITEQVAAVDAQQVPLSTDGLLLLPSARRPRVLAVRVVASPALAALHAQVERALEAAGVAPEGRLLLPHVTLARKGPGGDRALRRAVAESSPVASGTARTFSLVQSRLSADGPAYAPLCRVPLR